jgi:hypothetical protein
MKFLLPPTLLAALLVLTSFINGNSISKPTVPSPLSSYSTLWDDAKYLKCNTASGVNYMSASEKEVIYILNMARTNPVLFANTVIKQYPEKAGQKSLYNSHYYKSLLDTMLKLDPVSLLFPDTLCYNGAECHAINSGKEGYIGHQRSKTCLKKWKFNAECCDYGHNKALDILMALLIDEDVPSLGHRYICISTYKKIGVSIQPHKSYNYNAVLDFLY